MLRNGSFDRHQDCKRQQDRLQVKYDDICSRYQDLKFSVEIFVVKIHLLTLLY
jgi:hypothetical protein